MLFLAAGKTQDEYDEMVTKLCFPFTGSGTNNIEPIELVCTENVGETCHSLTQEQTSVNSFVTSFEDFTYDSFQDFISKKIDTMARFVGRLLSIRGDAILKQ